MSRKRHLHSFVPSDLDLYPLDLKFALLTPITFFQPYVSTKSEISLAFLFRKNDEIGSMERTDWMQRLMRSPNAGPHSVI